MATLLIIVSSSSTLQAIEIEKESVCSGLLFPGNLDPSSWRQEVPWSYWFAVSGGEIIGTLNSQDGNAKEDFD